MCLPIDSCFGFGTPRTDDYDHYRVPAASKPLPAPASISRGLPQLPAHHHGGHHNNGNGGHHYYNGNSYPTYAGAEADRKASNDVMKRGTAYHAAEAHMGRQNGHAAAGGAQEKMVAAYPHAAGADDGTLKQHPAASNARVAAAAADGARGGAPHNYYYYEPAHKEDAADSYYPAATATGADHERY